MKADRTLLVATDGQAVLRSHDDGKTWHRLVIDQDLEFDDCVRCLLADPRDPQAAFAGAEGGLFRTENCGANWHRVDSILNGQTIWKLAAAPGNADIMYAGTGSPGRATFYRSADAGRTWHETGLKMPPKCKGVSRPRMLAMAVDPDDARHVWVGIEEGGLFRTHDGGDNWERIDTTWPTAIGNSDVHSVVILRGEPKTIIVMVVNAIYRSCDAGRTWQRTSIKENWGIYYSRVLCKRPGNDDVLYMGIGDGTPGTTSTFLISTDRGVSWNVSPFPVQPNSCLWAIGSNAAEPDFILAGTKYGDLFTSTNGGVTWRKEWREFSEITDLAWLPVAPRATEVVSDGH